MRSVAKTALILSFIFSSCKENPVLTDVIKIDNYPSASGIEYFEQHFYLIGDDANKLLVLDKDFVVTDSISLYDFPAKRIPKAIKADLEAATILPGKKLLLVGSGSSVNRNTAWLIDLVSKQKDSIPLDDFYQRLKLNGIDELNIEGLCYLPGSIILANRGNKNYPKNHLIFADEQFWKKQTQSPLTVIHFGINTDSTVFNGVSGLAYSKKSDQLICTVSTEDTKNNMDDGIIGKSYLWIVNGISSKREWKAINPNRIIDLEEVDHRFKGQKIESVCITKETGNFLYLVLAADNDDGSSTLFRMAIKK